MVTQDKQKPFAETVGQFSELLAQMNDIHNELRAGNVSDRERIRFIGDTLFQLRPMVESLREQASSEVRPAEAESPLLAAFGQSTTHAMPARTGTSSRGGDFTKNYTAEDWSNILGRQNFGSGLSAQSVDLRPGTASLHVLSAFCPSLLEGFVRKSGKDKKTCELELLQSAYAIEAQRFAQEEMADRYHKSAVLLVKSALPHGGEGEMSDWYAEKQLESMVKAGVEPVWDAAYKLWGHSKAKHVGKTGREETEPVADGATAARSAAPRRSSVSAAKKQALPEKRKRVEFNPEVEVKTFEKPKKRYSTRQGSSSRG